MTTSTIETPRVPAWIDHNVLAPRDLTERVTAAADRIEELAPQFVEALEEGQGALLAYEQHLSSLGDEHDTRAVSDARFEIAREITDLQPLSDLLHSFGHEV